MNTSFRLSQWQFSPWRRRFSSAVSHSVLWQRYCCIILPVVSLLATHHPPITVVPITANAFSTGALCNSLSNKVRYHTEFPSPTFHCKMPLSTTRQACSKTTLQAKMEENDTANKGSKNVSKTETTVEVTMEEEDDATAVTPSSTASSSPRKRPRGTKAKAEELPSSADAEEEPTNSKTSPTKKKSKKKVKASSSSSADGDSEDAPANKDSPKKKKEAAAASDHQRITERDELPKLWTDEMAKANGSYTFRMPRGMWRDFVPWSRRVPRH
jgi:hypothetical protein